MMRTSDLLELSLRKLFCIKQVERVEVLVSVKQVERDERVEAVMVLDVR